MLSPQLKPARDIHATLAYSLTELAIVLTIVGLVAGMTLSVGKLQLEVAEAQSARAGLETIHQALLLFQKKYERYPCPALPADTSARCDLRPGGCGRVRHCPVPPG